MTPQALSAFVWSVADLLRGDYRQSDYGKVILPFTVLRRLDCVLEPTKKAVLKEFEARTAAGLNPEPFLLRKAGQGFYNTSPLDLKTLLGDQLHLRENLDAYIRAFSPSARDIFERFDFAAQIEKLHKSNLLYLVTEKFAAIDLHPEIVPNESMGHVFEELIRKFSELSNETAGEHFTPREVIRLMVNLLFIEDDEALSKPGVVRTIYDPTAGTGGMLSVAEDYLAEHNPGARLTMFGQELNDESYAICKADMLIKGQDVANIIPGNTLSDDGHGGRTFDYMLSNPPFGVEWKKIQTAITKEHKEKGHDGRFGPGLPRVSDGSLLFLLHLLSKMRPAKDGGSRFGIVLNGSPLFTGAAGSGESEIRRHVIESDLLEAIVALPTDMFYNTGIATYVWIVTNRKPAARRGKIQLIDASAFWQKMRKSLGSKRKELSSDHIADITRLFGEFKEVTRDGVPISRIFKNEDFGYRTITVERPKLGAFQIDRSQISEMINSDPSSRDLYRQIETWFGSDAHEDWESVTDDLKRIYEENEESWSHLTEDFWRTSFCRPIVHTKGKAADKPVADARLRDTENVPLHEDVKTYFKREVLPHAPDAWIDHEKTKVGYEIPFTRHFYVFTPPRRLGEIDAELKTVTDKIRVLLDGLSH